MPPAPGHRLLRFLFDRERFLYRDHRGKRVVADAEGSGAWSVRGEVMAEVDGEVTDRRSGRFSRSLTLTSDGDSEGEGQVLLGPPLSASAPVNRVTTPLRGSGWLVRGDSRLTADGCRAPAELLLPMPFFWGLGGDGEAEILDPGPAPILLDRFPFWDEGERAARGCHVQNLSKVSVLDSVNEEGERLSAPVVSHLNRASWTVEVPQGTSGLILRKRYDRFHGRQRARVLVEGQMAGWWYEPLEDRTSRWAWGQFGFDLMDDRRLLSLTIDPPPGTPLWSVSEIELWGLVG